MKVGMINYRSANEKDISETHNLSQRTFGYVIESLLKDGMFISL